MMNDAELSQVLHALQETEKEDIIVEERAKREAARKNRALNAEAMDIDSQVRYCKFC